MEYFIFCAVLKQSGSVIFTIHTWEYFYHLKSPVKRIRIFLCLEEQLVSASFLFGIDKTFILLGISCLVTSFSSP